MRKHRTGRGFIEHQDFRGADAIGRRERPALLQGNAQRREPRRRRPVDTTAVRRSRRVIFWKIHSLETCAVASASERRAVVQRDVRYAWDRTKSLEELVVEPGHRVSRQAARWNGQSQREHVAPIETG